MRQIDCIAKGYLVYASSHVNNAPMLPVVLLAVGPCFGGKIAASKAYKLMSKPHSGAGFRISREGLVMDDDQELFENFWSKMPDVIASRKDDFADPALRRTLHLSKIYAHQAWRAARTPLLEKIRKLERPNRIS